MRGVVKNEEGISSPTHHTSLFRCVQNDSVVSTCYGAVCWPQSGQSPSKLQYYPQRWMGSTDGGMGDIRRLTSLRGLGADDGHVGGVPGNGH